MDGDRQRLGAKINQRQLELLVEWNEIAERADMTPANLRRIRKGETSIPDLTAARLEAALEWESGSIRDVLAGGDPRPRVAGSPAPSHEPAPDPNDPRIPALLDRIDAMESELAQMRDMLRKLEDGDGDAGHGEYRQRA